MQHLPFLVSTNRNIPTLTKLTVARLLLVKHCASGPDCVHFEGSVKIPKGLQSDDPCGCKIPVVLPCLR